MTKEYFSHDYGTRHKKKLAALVHEHKMRGYGLFWVIVEMLHEDSTRWMDLDDLTYISIQRESGESVNYIKSFIDQCICRYKVFHQEDGRFTTERVLRNIDMRLEIKEKRAQAGRISGEVRRAKVSPDEQVLNKNEQVFDNAEQNGTKERKVNKSKVNNYLRPKGLTASFEADPAELRAKKGEYNSLIESLDGSETVDSWNAVKGFITDRKPEFVEPYIDLWNMFALTQRLIKQPIRITDHRRKKLETRVREPGFDFVATLAAIKKSDFLRGKNDRGWTVDFEFIIHSEENYTKILEEKYK